jgi:hypothetical protein
MNRRFAMPRWLDLSKWNALVLFLTMAVCALLVAWLGFGLINLAMANFGFLQEFGLMAIVEGGGVQALLLALRGLALLLAFFGFKAIETELIHRWRTPRD